MADLNMDDEKCKSLAPAGVIIAGSNSHLVGVPVMMIGVHLTTMNVHDGNMN